VIRKPGNPPLDEILMIGDSLSADIIGAENYGIDTVWFNKDGIENTSPVKSKYEIRNLAEIKSIV
ncbi:MAG: HAD hydrolase-like protein, partial [Oscillospiraceae bacterium]|nr:HAD hydrolase-like protein [Oscillospiraceae bacterium]